MAHILDETPEPRAWGCRMASPAPQYPHGTSYAQPCYSCGWVCPTCKRSYAPWVRECNYQHENGEKPFSMFGQYPLNVPAGGPGMPQGAVMSLRFPAEWSQPHYAHIVRAAPEWRDVLPGLQVLLGHPVGDGEETLLHFRLTPDVRADDPA